MPRGIRTVRPRGATQATAALLVLISAALTGCGDVTSPDETDLAFRGPWESRTQGDAFATTTIVMSGLESPRGLAFGPEGALYVTETGTSQINGPCATVVRGLNCFSGTGAISRLWKGRQERVASGLPSWYNPVIGDVAGPHHIGFQGRGGMYVTIGWGGEPAARAQLGALGADFGQLIKVEPNGSFRAVADIAVLEQANNPDGSPIPDSNPYGLLVEPSRQFVTDAGGNALLEVLANGEVSLVATFPVHPVPPGPFNPPFAASQAVPTQVRRGPDGALYVSELTGVPFLPGVAGIYRVVPGQAPTLYLGGFTQITDFAWAPDGNLYVLQHASAPFFGGPGSLIQVAPEGTRTTVTATLDRPTGLAIGRDHAVYVAHRHLLPGGGEVIRIAP